MLPMTGHILLQALAMLGSDPGRWLAATGASAARPVAPRQPLRVNGAQFGVQFRLAEAEIWGDIDGQGVMRCDLVCLG